MNSYTIIFITLISVETLLLAITICALCKSIKRAHECSKKLMMGIMHTVEFTSANSFMDHIRQSIKKDFKGIYIIKNQDKNMVYVGQSVHVFQRITSHLQGHGNGDIYSDYKAGDTMLVYWEKYSHKYHDLNEMERVYIEMCSSWNGVTMYNKTKGNN